MFGILKYVIIIIYLLLTYFKIPNIKYDLRLLANHYLAVDII